jgi:isoleucyl-tRNA synthetase
VKFPVVEPAAGSLAAAPYVVIWTTTPWTIPANRAISSRRKIAYGLYESPSAENNFGPQPGESYFADKLAAECYGKGQGRRPMIAFVVPVADMLAGTLTNHPLRGLAGGYRSTSRCSTATTSPTMPAPASCTPRPATAARTSTHLDGVGEASCTRAASIPAIPFTVDDAGFFTKDAPGFGPDREGGAARVIDDNGKKGDANKARHRRADRSAALFARGRLKHQLSAFLAFEEADHLPQHAAVVRLHGQGARRRQRRRYAAQPARSGAIDDDAFVPPPARTACAP